MWSVLNVPTMWYFNCPRQRGMFLLFLQCGILTVLAVWYISCPDSPTMWNVLNVPTLWYFNCPQQYGIFLLFLEYGILTVHDNVKCSYCSESVVF
jgi:hypothetical protein